MRDVVGHVAHSIFTIELVTGYAGQDPEMILHGDGGCPGHTIQPAHPVPGQYHQVPALALACTSWTQGTRT